MHINWLLISVLFCCSLPGILIAIPRLIRFLLPDNSLEMRRRASRFVMIQTGVMVLAMSFIGSVLSPSTGLGDPIFSALLQGTPVWPLLVATLLPVLGYASLCFVLFALVYYVLVSSILDERSILVIAKLRAALRLDGCILYGGIVEEILVRWGLVNILAFFTLLFMHQLTPLLIIIALFLSGFLFALSQMPLYVAAGCVFSRRLSYSLFLLHLIPSLFFGIVFWHYGLIASIMAHCLFHLFWAGYDKT